MDVVLVIDPIVVPVVDEVTALRAWRFTPNSEHPGRVASTANLLSEAARKAFEMLPQSYRFQDEALRKSFDKGTAKALLRVLDRRNVALSAEQRERIDSCTDSDQLERWLDRAIVVNSAHELFADE